MELTTAVIISIGSFLTSVASLLINIFKSSKDSHKESSKEMQEVVTKVAVLEERITNEGKILNKIEEQLDKIEDKL